MRIVALHGAERFLIIEHSRALVGVLRAEFGELDIFTIDGERASIADVLDELRSYALIQRHKLVILEDADAFLKPPDEDEDGGKARENPKRKALEHYAQSPMPEATLLLRGETWRSGNLDKLIKAVGTIIECKLYEPAAAIRWCIGRAASHHDASLSEDAAIMLVERAGVDLSRLDSELGKLATHQGPSAAIDAATVALMVPASRQEKAWAIQAAILSGQPDAALAKLRELLDISRQDEVPLTWAVADLTRKLHAVARMLEQGIGRSEIWSRAKLWGKEGEAIFAVAQRLRPLELAQLLRRAVDTDMAGKSGRGDPTRNLEALTILVADSMGGRSTAKPLGARMAR